MAVPLLLTIVVAQVTVPYTTSFEANEGYTQGAFTTSSGWQVFGGTATVVRSDAFAGSQSIELAAHTPPSTLVQTFGAVSDKPVIFVDFFARPACGSDLGVSTRIDVESSRIGVLRVSDAGEVRAFDGDGNGGGSWLETSAKLPVNAEGQAVGWTRFTFRQDYVLKKWDLYVNGAMVAASLGFRNNAADHFSIFGMQGASVGTTYLDYFYAGADNPLFVDRDADGLPDSWEQQYLGTLEYAGRDDPARLGRPLAESFLKRLDPTSVSPERTEPPSDGGSDRLPTQLAVAPSAVMTLAQRPAYPGVFVDTGNFKDPVHFAAASAMLPDGRVLFAGGQYTPNPDFPLSFRVQSSAEIYDPKTGVFTLTGSLHRPRFGAAAVTLPNGKIAVVGGLEAASVETLCEIEVWDPTTGTFEVVGYTPIPRGFVSAAALNDGRIFITGGKRQTGVVTGDAWVFDPQQRTIITVPVLTRTGSALVRLQDGRILIIGGRDPNTGATKALELFDPATNSVSHVADMTEVRASPQAILLSDGRVMICGGGIHEVYTEWAPQLAEIFDPAAGKVTATFPMPYENWLTEMADGRVYFGAAGKLLNVQTGSVETIPAEGMAENIPFGLPDGRLLLAESSRTELPGLSRKFRLFVPDNWGIVDADNDGLPDAWEQQYLGTLNYSGTDDPGAVGRTLAQSYQQQVSPWPTATVSTGLRAWYRADLGVGKETDGKVNRWTDLSGQGVHLGQPVSGWRPAWVESGVNGQPSVRFSAAMLKSGLADVQAGSSDLTVIAVVQPEATQGSNAAVVDFSRGGTEQGFALEQNGGTTNQYLLFWLNAGRNSWQGGGQLVNAASGRGQILSYVKGGTTQEAYLNGVKQSGGAVQSAMWTPITELGLGARTNYSGGFSGQIAEVVIYNRALSAAERQQIETALVAKYVNPDSDGDGLLDSWEKQYFGSLGVGALDDPDADGLTNLREVQLGTDPTKADTDGDGIPDATEVAMGLNPLVADSDLLPKQIGGLRLLLSAASGVTSDANGFVSAWADQSGRSSHATQSLAARRPIIVSSALNGKPVIRFDAAQTQYLSLPNFMSGANAGEVLVVVRCTNESGSGLWKLGPGSATVYYGGYSINEDFGTSSTRYVRGPAGFLSEYRIYDVAAGAGSWAARWDGALLFRSAANTVSFASTPQLGSNYSTGFTGDIAEVIVYDRVLTEIERDAIGTYLQSKYRLPGISAPDAPTEVVASPISSTQVSVVWKHALDPDGTVYVLDRKRGTGDFVKIAELQGCLSFVDSGLVENTTYTYRVSARNYSGWSVPATSAQITTAGGTALLPISGIRLWLKADAGVPSGTGPLPYWHDQTSAKADAAQTAAAKRPTLVENVLNGRPVIRFDATKNQYFTLPNCLSSATAADVFAIVKLTDAAGYGLWRMGDASVMYYTASSIGDDCGSSAVRKFTGPTNAFSSYGLYNITAGRSWIARFNGVPLYEAAQNTVRFTTAPLLGNNYTTGFTGDIAEIIVYDRTLAEPEREAVGRYLTGKYQLPGLLAAVTPTGVVAMAMSGTQISLSWSDAQSAQGVTYTIERATGNGEFAVIAEIAGSLSYIDTGLTAGTTYRYRIKGRTYAGSSSYSTVAEAALPVDAPNMPLDHLRLWLRADAGITSGEGPVTTWRDQSGVHNDATQLVTAIRPQLVANVINGRPAVRFTAASKQFFVLPNNFMNGAAAGEVYVVLKAATAAGTNRTLWKIGDGETSYPTKEGYIMDAFGSSGRYGSGVPAANLAQFNLYNATSEAGSWVSRLNGAVYGSSTSNTVRWMTSGPQLGGRSYWEETFDGDIAEVIIYDRALTAIERESVSNYLALKYALPGVERFGEYRDTNGDRLTDAEDRRLGLDPYSPDADGDGVPNAAEVANGTDPTSADTDADGVPDGVDAYPLDPARHEGPGPNAGDQTPPNITLSKPQDAVLVP